MSDLTLAASEKAVELFNLARDNFKFYSIPTARVSCHSPRAIPSFHLNNGSVISTTTEPSRSTPSTSYGTP